jgi:hypothetical protein
MAIIVQVPVSVWVLKAGFLNTPTLSHFDFARKARENFGLMPLRSVHMKCERS